jgi:3-deoxy-manno-octulosonate cytidylyltransferase (CMP-KDO synthetase)
MSTSKAAAIIPARYGSTRFPGKPLFEIAGKSLLRHVWDRCVEADGIDRVIVATDDMRIAEAVFAFGAEVSLTSPRHQTGTDRIAEVAARLKGIPIILNVQGDEPLVSPKLLGQLVEEMRADPKLAMATAASPFCVGDDPSSPNAVKVVLGEGDRAIYFSRSLIPFHREAVTGLKVWRHIGLYAYRRNFLMSFVKLPRPTIERAESLEQLRAVYAGVSIKVVRSKTAAPGIDSPEDVAAVEALLAAQKSRRKK